MNDEYTSEPEFDSLPISYHTSDEYIGNLGDPGTPNGDIHFKDIKKSPRVFKIMRSDSRIIELLRSNVFKIIFPRNAQVAGI